MKRDFALLIWNWQTSNNSNGPTHKMDIHKATCFFYILLVYSYIQNILNPYFKSKYTKRIKIYFQICFNTLSIQLTVRIKCQQNSRTIAKSNKLTRRWLVELLKIFLTSFIFVNMATIPTPFLSLRHISNSYFRDKKTRQQFVSNVNFKNFQD